MPALISEIADIYPALLRGATIIQYQLHDKTHYGIVINCELCEVTNGLVNRLVDNKHIAFIQSNPTILGITTSGQRHGGVEKPGIYWVAEMREKKPKRLVYETPRKKGR